MARRTSVLNPPPPRSDPFLDRPALTKDKLAEVMTQSHAHYAAGADPAGVCTALLLNIGLSPEYLAASGNSTVREVIGRIMALVPAKPIND